MAVASTFDAWGSASPTFARSTKRSRAFAEEVSVANIMSLNDQAPTVASTSSAGLIGQVGPACALPSYPWQKPVVLQDQFG
jgi:hypothetical protein